MALIFSSSSSGYGATATATDGNGTEVRLFFSTFYTVLRVALVLCSLAAAAGSRGQPSTDTEALTIFRQKVDVHGILASNWTTTRSDACGGRWMGVVCGGGRVISLSLPSLDLRGTLESLSSLSHLRFLDLHSNRLNGTLTPIASSFPNLKLLYLSHNDISGGIPSFGGFRRLVRLDVSDNSLRGPIPDAVANLSRLLTLRLENNLLTGAIPDLTLALPGLRELDVSNNKLSGMIPQPMRSRFGDAPFAGNAGLCASLPPFPSCPPASAHHDNDHSQTVAVAPSVSSSSPSDEVVPSSHSFMPGSRTPNDVLYEGNGKGKLSLGAVIAIAAGNAAVLLLLSCLLLAYYCCFSRRAMKDDDDEEEEKAAGKCKSEEDRSIKYYNGYYQKQHSGRCLQGEVDGGSGGVPNNKLVFFDDGDEEGDHYWTDGGRMRAEGPGHFELEDLLRSSAEMMGRGSLGTVYRAVLEDGWMVAVKRLRDANPCERRDFEGYMNLIGRSRHPNLVPLKAYYYAPQEKLLVYDYIPNGTLHALIHGRRHHHHHHRRGQGLDWTTRVHLALGAATGLSNIHQKNDGCIPHGNVTSSNILVDAHGNARLSDFGLALLLDPANATAKLGGYRAPEQQHTKSLSLEADVYALGVIFLELLTVKDPNSQQDATLTNLPDWVRSVVREEWTAEVFDAELLQYRDVQDEMVAMLHIALACTADLPHQRPTMPEVVKMVADVRLPQSDEDPRISSLSATDDDHLV